MLKGHLVPFPHCTDGTESRGRVGLIQMYTGQQHWNPDSSCPAVTLSLVKVYKPQHHLLQEALHDHQDPSHEGPGLPREPVGQIQSQSWLYPLLPVGPPSSHVT